MGAWRDTAGPFGARLRRLRDAAGFSQEELASRAGLTAKGISAIERGERKRPYPHTVRALADALGLSGGERDAFVAAAPRRAGMAYDAPATASRERATLLPTPPTPLVGRDREVAAVTFTLERSETRLLTLTGPGGVGKTRLTLEVAAGAAETVPDGVALVELAPIMDPDLLPSTIARALGLRETGGRPAHELLLGHMEDRRMLIVLDNFEHLLGAAPEVAGLLSACPCVKVLATSRAPLRVRGEREYPVEPLAVPDPSHSPDALNVAGSPAVKLFARRALEANPAFSLTRNNAAAVAAICWRLDGLPLALELAAVRSRFLGPTQLLARLDQSLESGEARDLPERQRTMRATMDWSHDLLSDEEKVTFHTLSVFAGGFSLEAVESVGEDLGAAHTADLLGSLVEQSLIAADAGGSARYRMLEPIRQYALEKLGESGEGERIRGRHADYYLALADRARPELQGPHQATWLDTLAREHDNVRATIGWLLERGNPQGVARIGWGIYDFWFRRGYTGEGLRWMERVLSERGTLPFLMLARALWVTSALSFVRGDLDRAAATAAESVAAARGG